MIRLGVFMPVARAVEGDLIRFGARWCVVVGMDRYSDGRIVLRLAPPDGAVVEVVAAPGARRWIRRPAAVPVRPTVSAVSA